MNKLVVIVWIGALLGLGGCASKRAEEDKAPANSGPVVGSAVGPSTTTAPSPAASAGSAEREPAGSAAPANGEPARVGGTTYSAPPSATAPSAAAAAANAAIGGGCATANKPTCAADQEDGCTSGRTAVHVCVAKAAKAGPPCAQELAMTCPTGQIDACLHTPPLANNHLCVIVGPATP